MSFLRFIRTLTIRQKLIITISTGTLFVIFITGAAALYKMSEFLEKELIDKGAIIATDLSKQSINSILHEDVWELYRYIKTMTASTHMPFLNFIVILDRDGRILAHSNPREHRIGELFRDETDRENIESPPGIDVQQTPLSKEESLYVITVPSYLDNELIGLIKVGLTDRIMKENLSVFMRNIILLSSFLTIISIAVGVFIANHIASPLTKVTQNIIKISEGQLKDIIPVQTTESDEIGRMVTVFNEMTKNLKTQKEMSEYLVKKEKLAMIGELASNIAHEVKNPLTGIKLGIDAMRRDGSTREDVLERLEKEIHRIDRVTSRLLSISKTMPLELKKVALQEIVEESMYFVAKVAAKKGIHMHYSSSEEDICVYADSDQIQQSLLNILLNAIHATEKGGNIYISTKRDDNWASIVVRDTGCGISPEIMPKVFESFFTTNPLSTGLGLAIAQRIVTEHKGDIFIESVIDQGTAVSIVLPLHVSSAKEVCNAGVYSEKDEV